jgi:hypothetical protein
VASEVRAGKITTAFICITWSTKPKHNFPEVKRGKIPEKLVHTEQCKQYISMLSQLQLIKCNSKYLLYLFHKIISSTNMIISPNLLDKL